MRPIVDGLVEEGLVRRVDVEDGGPPVVVQPACRWTDARRPAAASSRRSTACCGTSRSWARFGFSADRVYKREHERIYGYYVLPFRGRPLVGGADLKSTAARACSA